jgi:hypothetical protein
MIEEKILTPILEYYINAPYEDVVKNIIDKERVATVKNMQIIIYSNDHNPPHFHVISKDKSIDAKFTIADCSYMSGEIGTKDVKRIQAFHADMKTQLVMKMIWDKKK